jgi:hypothetical protein
MRDGSQWGMNAIFIAWECHAAMVLDAISFPALAINGDVSITIHHAPVIQTVK